ncbi:hypothetical protein BJ989_003113 [Nocardioides perillae]|uniref:Uncharacterized protein n=1 Tax=Nocardioides perillae TaxID=1119534 RepID=A0A7Y9RWX3_9ACTN|nr:hypothetical protein [Nocardioides perillae]
MHGSRGVSTPAPCLLSRATSRAQRGATSPQDASHWTLAYSAGAAHQPLPPPCPSAPAGPYCPPAERAPRLSSDERPVGSYAQVRRAARGQ